MYNFEIHVVGTSLLFNNLGEWKIMCCIFTSIFTYLKYKSSSGGVWPCLYVVIMNYSYYMTFDNNPLRDRVLFSMSLLCVVLRKKWCRFYSFLVCQYSLELFGTYMKFHFIHIWTILKQIIIRKSDVLQVYRHANIPIVLFYNSAFLGDK